MNNWEETVMNGKQIATWLLGVSDRYYDAETKPTISDIAIATAQAKLTWEARQKEVDEAEQRGIQKVADELRGLMIKTYDPLAPSKYSLVLCTDEDKWQAFLKSLEGEKE